MYKVLWLLKRKPGISLSQFRDHYENSHAILGQRYLGHLLVEYKRNYKVEVWGGGVPTEPGEPSFGPREWEYDCVTEWVMPDEEAFNEIMRIFADPVIGKFFHDDEENFLDRGSVVLIKCDGRDTGTGDGAETLKLRRETGGVA
jgi:EthD domain